MNNLTNILPFNIYIKLCIVAIFFTVNCFNLQAQDNLSSGKKYTIGNISVLGNTSFGEQVIINFSGLRKGQEINIPGEEIGNAIKKLWKTQLFNNIEVYVTNIKNKTANLEIRLEDLPQLNEIKVNGVKKSKVQGVIDDNKLKKGTKVTENLITTTKNFLTRKYKKDGFLNTKVHINTIEVKDSIKTARVNMVLNIDKGEKVKIKDIVFNGNKALKTKL